MGVVIERWCPTQQMLGVLLMDIIELVFGAVGWIVAFGAVLLIPWLIFEAIRRLIWAFKVWPLGEEEPPKNVMQ
jgi:hypothetical protein